MAPSPGWHHPSSVLEMEVGTCLVLPPALAKGTELPPRFHPQLQDAGVRSNQSHLPALPRTGTTVGWILPREAPGNTRAPRPTPRCCWLCFPIWIWLGTEPLVPSTGAGRCQHMEAITGAGSRCEEGPEQHSPSRGLCSGLCPRCGTREMPQPPACSLCWHSARAGGSGSKVQRGLAWAAPMLPHLLGSQKGVGVPSAFRRLVEGAQRRPAPLGACAHGPPRGGTAQWRGAGSVPRPHVLSVARRPESEVSPAGSWRARAAQSSWKHSLHP